MRQATAAASWLCLCALFGTAAGCASHPFSVPSPRQAFQPPPPTAAAVGQAHEFQSRAAGLDADNQQLQALLAKQQQQTAQLQNELQKSQQKISTLQNQVHQERSQGPAAKGSPGVAASPTSYAAALPLVNIPGAEVVRDGDLVRIRIETGQLFAAGKAELKPAVTGVLDHVAKALRMEYSDRLTGIEGYTDADPITRSKWHSNHELAVSRSVAVFEALKRKGVPERQLFVAGYGPNRPLTDNSSANGKAKNRRVEIVIHPQPPS